MGYDKIENLIDKASNGLEALQMVKEGIENKTHSYALIFMDLSMPIMDGFEASLQIRNYLKTYDMPQPKIIACTGHLEEEYIQKAWRNKMDEVLSKPIVYEILQIVLEEIIQLN